MHVLQAGLSDLQRQKLQQKIEVELNEKRDQHLSVLKKNSVDQSDSNEDCSSEIHSAVVVMDDIGTTKSKARDLKREDESSDDDDDEDNQDIIDDDINRTENFKSLPGDLIDIQLKRNDFGFGLALAGHSNRNRMGTFICGLHPQGAAFENGRLQVGDELLKIHKTVVRGRSHLLVSALIKKIPNINYQITLLMYVIYNR